MTAVQSPSVEAGTGFGVHSEVGKLRRVMIHRPDLELQRLTPDQPRRAPVRRRPVGPPGPPAARRVRRPAPRPRRRGPVSRDAARRDPGRSPRRAVGARPRRDPVHGRRRDGRRGAGLPGRGRPGRPRRPPHRRADGPGGHGAPQGQGRRGGRRGRAREAARSSCPRWSPDDFVLRPLPNSYFTRDPSAWIYGGVVVNPMYWPARRLEALNVEIDLPLPPRSATPGSSSGTRGSRRASRSAAPAARAATSCRSATARSPSG